VWIIIPFIIGMGFFWFLPVIIPLIFLWAYFGDIVGYLVDGPDDRMR